MVEMKCQTYKDKHEAVMVSDDGLKMILTKVKMSRIILKNAFKSKPIMKWTVVQLP